MYESELVQTTVKVAMFLKKQEKNYKRNFRRKIVKRKNVS